MNLDEIREHAASAPLEQGAWAQRAAVLLTEAAQEIETLRKRAIGIAAVGPSFREMRPEWPKVETP